MSRILRIDQTKMYIVISYDITNDKVRNKIMRICEKFWFRSQKSIFEAYIRPADFEIMKRQINWIIKLAKNKRKNLWDEDQVKFYFISKTWEDYHNKIDWLWPWYEKIKFNEFLIF